MEAIRKLLKRAVVYTDISRVFVLQEGCEWVCKEAPPEVRGNSFLGSLRVWLGATGLRDYVIVMVVIVYGVISH